MKNIRSLESYIDDRFINDPYGTIEMVYLSYGYERAHALAKANDTIVSDSNLKHPRSDNDLRYVDVLYVDMLDEIVIKHKKNKTKSKMIILGLFMSSVFVLAVATIIFHKIGVF